jgi:hypothetical protein
MANSFFNENCTRQKEGEIRRNIYGGPSSDFAVTITGSSATMASYDASAVNFLQSHG